MASVILREGRSEYSVCLQPGDSPSSVAAALSLVPSEARLENVLERVNKRGRITRELIFVVHRGEQEL